MAFWLQADLARSGAVLLDTWGIMPVALEVMRISGRNFNYDCLPAHALTAREESIERLRRLYQLAQKDSQITFLQSFRASGQLQEELKAELLENGLDEQRFSIVSIYGWENPSLKDLVLAFIAVQGRSFKSENQCDLCTEGLEVVRIDPKLYYVVAPSEQQTALLTPKYWNVSNTFFENYHNISDLFRVHANHPHDKRHHGFYLHTQPLLAHDGFKSKFLQKVRAIQPLPTLVVSPKHSCGVAMASLVTEALGIAAIHSERLRRNELNSAEVRLVSEAESILIVDDVVISGTRLRSYLCALREEFSDLAKGLRTVSFVAGIARPPTSRAWKEVCTACSNHGQLRISCDYVEYLMLPNWPQEKCPWCREFDFLSRCSQSLSRPPEWLRKRILQLSDKRGGVINMPLLILSDNDLVLGSQSLAGPKGMNATATLFATASALQSLRDAENRKDALSPGFPVSNVFNVERNFGNHSEGLLRAALLRCLRPEELPTGGRRAHRDQFLAYSDQSGHGSFAGELLLAISRGGVSPPNWAVWNRLLHPFGTDFAMRSAELLNIMI